MFHSLCYLLGVGVVYTLLLLSVQIKSLVSVYEYIVLCVSREGSELDD